MADGDGWGMLVAALLMVGLVVLVLAAGLAMGWLDRRISSNAPDAVEDLARYGPSARGLRVELLPEEQRAKAIAERRERG